MSTIEAIVFDLGGVLVELKGVPVVLEWSALGLDEQTLWHRWLHSPAVRAFETGRLSPSDFADQVIDELHLRVGRQQFLDAFSAWPAGLFPGVPALLQHLRKEHTLACLSNTSALHWPRLMGEMGLETMLDHHFASHVIGKIKPDRECFEHVIEALQLPPEQVLFFDDNAINVDNARHLGMQAVHVKDFNEVVEHMTGRGLYRAQ